MNYREELEKCASAPVEFQGMEKDAYAWGALAGKIGNAFKGLWGKATNLANSPHFGTATTLANGGLTAYQVGDTIKARQEESKQKEQASGY